MSPNGPERDYVSVVYNEQRTPPSSYPDRLAAYLCDRFSLSQDDKLLEIGCGRGDFLAAFGRRGLKVSGVDRETVALLYPDGIDFKTCDLAVDGIPYPDNTFDVVYHKSVLEHFYDPMPLMQETLRVLKPGGKLIILTPDWQSQYKVFFEDFTHCRPYDTLSMADLLIICGLRSSGSELFRQLPVLWTRPWLRPLSGLIGILVNVPLARRLTRLTGLKFIRWSSERMVLGYGLK